MPESKLVGSVTYKGKPVPHALILVSPSSTGPNAGLNAQAFADKDGKFVVENAPLGQVGVGVNTDAGRRNMIGEAMAASVSGEKSRIPTFVDVPKKYFEPLKSGIQINIDNPKGATSFDIKLD